MLPRSTENAVTSHMWPAGLQLDHTDLVWCNSKTDNC